MPELDYKEILERFMNNLECEINNQADVFHIAFMLNHYTQGNMTDEDCIEMRGYYKGLKVAREMMQRVIDCCVEERGIYEE